MERAIVAVCPCGIHSRRQLDDGGVVGTDLINHGLNTVLIRERANIILGGKEPTLYLDNLKKKDDQLTVKQLKNRIKSHFVPYDELAEGTGAAKDQYKEYLMARAKVIWKEIKVRTE